MSIKTKINNMLDKRNLYSIYDDFYSINNINTDDSFDEKTSDSRVWKSNIEDIDGGDNFADYCKEFFQLLDEEGYYDN